MLLIYSFAYPIAYAFHYRIVRARSLNKKYVRKVEPRTALEAWDLEIHHFLTSEEVVSDEGIYIITLSGTPHGGISAISQY